jgi:hypothetical protein
MEAEHMCVIDYYNNDNPTWETAKGQEIPLSRMSDTHLENAINYCKRLLHELYSMPDISVFLEEADEIEYALMELEIEAKRRERKQITVSEIDNPYYD